MGPAQRESLGEADAWRAYRSAFADFAKKVRQVQVLTASPNADRQAVDAALLALERARVVYNHSRDALAQQFLQSPMRSMASGDAQDRVRNIAALRWEMAGRPDGTADDDWYRAEQIVRDSAAA